MKKFLVFPLMLLNMMVNGQNLIPNPSFEDHDTCPSTVSQLYYCTGWEQILPTSDYYHFCGSFDGDFTNYFGNNCPNSGDAYAGSICYWKSGGPKNREILGTILISPLIVGQKYYCTYHINLANNPTYRAGINKYGVKLSTTPFAHDSTLIDNNSFFHSDSVVLDTGGWVQFKQSFIADSAYLYIALGVFYEDTFLTINHSLTSASKSYYYIDDVCLSVDSLTCNYAVTTTCYPTGMNDVSGTSNIQVAPNPFIDYLQIEAEPGRNYDYQISDVSGRCIKAGKFSGNVRLESRNWQSGMYFLQVFEAKKLLLNKKFIKALQ